jgi:RNA polymerase sigma-70 factor (ECF subfamily)
VAWQKFAEVPQRPEDRLWLFGVARRCIADQRRADGRQLRLVLRLSSDVLLHGANRDCYSDPRAETVLETIDRLAPLDREALQLVLWDGLSHDEAARVMECSVAAFESRYRRARNAVRAVADAALPKSSNIHRAAPSKGEQL